MANNFFSIEFDERYIKIIDLHKSGDLYEINHIGKEKLLENFYSSDIEKIIYEQADIIKKLINVFNIQKKNVVISIPNYYTYHQIFEMPILKEKELISAIKYQADQFIPMPIEETNIDIQIIKEDNFNKKLLILVVAAPKKLIEKIKTTIELAGLIPEAIETHLSSSSRLISEFLSNKINDNGVMIIDFDYYSSTFFSFKENPLILYKNHNIAFGYNLFLKELSINTTLDFKKAENLLIEYSSEKQTSVAIEDIFKPLINEFVNEINRFVFSDNHKTIYFINEIVNFPYLINLLKKKMPNINFNILSPQVILNKSSLLESISFELPLYFSIVGTDLR